MSDAARFVQPARHWIFHRLRLRWPGAMARLSRELPLVSVLSTYSEVPSWDRAIPNVVYQTWVDPYLGRSHARNVRAFRTTNADFSFRFFDETSADAFMTQHFSDHPIYPIYVNARYGPMRADIWRYCILFLRGGVYCDIGKAINRPLREFIRPETRAVVSFERRSPLIQVASEGTLSLLLHPERRVINWALMCEPGHPLMRRAIDGVVRKYPAYRNVSIFDPKQAILEFTGPIHLSECLAAHVTEEGGADVTQVGIDFDGEAIWELPGSYVRYTRRPAYILARNDVIVS